MNQFDHLDEIAADLRTGDSRRVGVLSSGERIYVYLAANMIPPGETIASALHRLGPDWLVQLIDRHKYD